MSDIIDNESVEDEGLDVAADEADAKATDEGAEVETNTTAEPTEERRPRVLRHPEGIEMFQASNGDLEEMKADLFKQSQGRELFFQEFQHEEDGPVTLFGYPRTQVMDFIYSVAYPIVKLIDDHASVKVKSNRAVSDFFIIILTRKSGTYIGKHGVTLDSLDGLINHSVSRHFPRWVNITVDVDNYRRKRNSYLEGVIRRLIRDIERDHRERKMPNLLSKERKFVHQFFTEHPYLTTESRGKGKDRVLYITPRDDIREI